MLVDTNSEFGTFVNGARVTRHVLEEDDVIRLTDHHELDLERSVREAILLAEPIAPLDREDCPGLCVVCGLPLDEGSHDHPDDEVDPRLEVLRAFLPAGDE